MDEPTNNGTPPWPPLLTAEQTIAYLQLGAGGRNAQEKLKNLMRRHALPNFKRGGLRLFPKDGIDAWLRGERTEAPRTKHPSRLASKRPAQQRVTQTNNK